MHSNYLKNGFFLTRPILSWVELFLGSIDHRAALPKNAGFYTSKRQQYSNL
jgi:hypothetical protein